MTDRKLIAGLFGLAGLTLAACQSPYTANPEQPGIQAPSPNFPVRADANPPAPPAPPQSTAAVNPPAPGFEDEPVVTQRPAPGPIVAETLPPPSAPQPAAPVYTPPPVPVTETRMITTGPVVDADGPSESYTVKSGDTLYSISRRMDMTVAQAASLNGLKEPYTLKPGQKLKGKPVKSKAYVVQGGDTLSAIGRRFSVSAAQIAEANDSETGATIRPGQRLMLPAGYRDLGAQRITVTVASAPAPVAPTPVAPAQQTVVASAPPARTTTPASSPRATPTALQPAPRPQTPPATQVAAAPPPAPRPSAPAIIPTTPPSTPSDIQSAGRGKFIWPISGRQLNGFGVRGGNQVSNGLNIAASTGATVRAAGPGQVIYAGDEVQGFGNLVLVEHEDGFVSVYAHLSKALVTMRQQVQQGQAIGEVGTSGGVPEPQLYFEMRHRPSPRDPHKPFDPILVLPSR